MKNLINYITTIIVTLSIVSCTDLEEQALDGVVPTGSGSASADLRGVLNEVAAFHNEWARHLGIQEMPGDAMAGPTRGGDWDDNAVLRQMHTHTLGSDHPWTAGSYNIFMTGIYKADLVLSDSGQSADHAAAKFMKAYFYYQMIDKFGVVPYRADYTDMTQDASVYSRSEAFAEAVTMATDALSNLPEKVDGQADKPNKDAARMLLAKLHMNRAVFTGEPGATTFTFDAADMTAAIDYIDDMVSTLKEDDSDGTSYWFNFDKDNDQSSELIWALKQEQGADDSVGGTSYHWRMGQHYNQTPDGWNGPVMLGEYYDYFQENRVAEGSDPRATWSTDELTATTGNSIGVQRGQIYKPGGTDKVKDRNGLDLVFSKDVPLVVTDKAAIESAGYRIIKYVPHNFNEPESDMIIFRYADALLLRAEAALRGGTGGDAQADLDAVRARVGLGSITASLDNVYAERARELWFEGHRRNDMIRWGTFLSAKELKSAESDPKYLLFPLPADALLNPNIDQNPGY